MNARAYRHHASVSRAMTLNVAVTIVAVACIAAGIVWPMVTSVLATLDKLSTIPGL